jgi:hypothetical protein
VQTWPRVAFWVLIPGTFGLARGQRSLGIGLLGVWLGMLVAYWIWIGTPAATWAYLLASAIHAISASIVFATCLTHLSRESGVWRASLYGFLTVLVLYSLSPFRLTRGVVLLIEVQGTTVLINPVEPANELGRGDWIAYRFNKYPGAGFDRILALPGETLRFHKDAFEVNGTAYRRISEQMPTQGEMPVAKGEYFVWPESARYGRGGGAWAPELLRGFAIVSHDHVIGQAYHRWLWRKQELDPLVVLKDWTPPSLHP